MKCLFRYCFNRVLSRRMGSGKSLGFSGSRISSLQLRYASNDTDLVDSITIAVDRSKALKKPPTFYTSLSGIVDDFDILRKLVDLGVDLRAFERDLSLCGMLVTLDYDMHVVPFLKFLTLNGVPEEELGRFITSNPRIFLSDMDDLQVRVNYLLSKKFDKGMIATIITKFPKWLSHSVRSVDSHLGHLQKSLLLTGDEVRQIVVAFPSVLRVRQEDITHILSIFKNTFSQDNDSIKSIFLKKPRLLKVDPDDIKSTYFFLTEDMSLSNDIIMAQPGILLYRVHFLKPRHLFLKKLCRNQYNPNLPGYVSLMKLAMSHDETFAEEIAMVDVQLYYDFQKTL